LLPVCGFWFWGVYKKGERRMHARALKKRKARAAKRKAQSATTTPHHTARNTKPQPGHTHNIWVAPTYDFIFKRLEGLDAQGLFIGTQPAP
jgi:hypothetical protein